MSFIIRFLKLYPIVLSVELSMNMNKCENSIYLVYNYAKNNTKIKNDIHFNVSSHLKEQQGKDENSDELKCFDIIFR